MEFDVLLIRVFGWAIQVHREPGSGLPVSTYEQCLARKLTLQGMAFQLQQPQPTCLPRTLAAQMA